MTTTMKGGPLARLAGQLCSNSEFQQWIGADCKDSAAEILRTVCQIDSRAQLDHDAGAARLFHQHIRGPWVKGARFVEQVTA